MTAVAAARPATLDRRPARRPRWERPALAALLTATAALYIVGLSRNGWANDFYSAAVQAGTTSWKAFFFGSLDSSNFITVDKTPASLWVMELSARAFGLNYWSLLVPQALEGVATVAVLYAAVRRWSGTGAALLAGAVMASTPVAALMFRFNNPDALLTLLMAAACYAMVRAIESGRTRWIALAGALIGLGFLTKMMQAFLVLPAFALAYLVAGPPRLARRVWPLLAGAAVLVAAAGWWIAAVMLTPAADRPYVGGSTNDSILQLALGYNGLGRLDGHETGSVGFGTGTSPAFSGATGLGRLFGTDMGGQISWLLPAALLALGALAWVSRRAPRTDRTRAAVLLWGGWLLITGLVFSFMAGIIHPYYTVALAPPIGALTGIGATRLWRARAGWPARGALAAGVTITALWSYALLDRTPAWHPLLRAVIVAAGLIAAAALLAGPALAGLARTARGRAALAVAPVSLALLAAFAGPAAYSLDTAAAAHTGAIPSAGPALAAAGGPGAGGGPGRAVLGTGRPGQGRGQPGTATGGSTGGTSQSGQPGSAGTSTGSPPGAAVGGGPGVAGSPGPGGRSAGSGSGTAGAGGPGGPGGTAGPGGGLGGSTWVSAALTALLRQGASGYRWAAATVGSESAAPLQLAARQPIMSMGGFNGTDPAPSLAEFKRLVADHEIHYFVGANAHSFGGGSGAAAQITTWVRTHFRAQTVGGTTVYDLTRPLAGT
jgi:4-amino-4-deoxy-L-arabinose transferase-like glycosyltransferase